MPTSTRGTRASRNLPEAAATEPDPVSAAEPAVETVQCSAAEAAQASDPPPQRRKSTGRKQSAAAADEPPLPAPPAPPAAEAAPEPTPSPVTSPEAAAVPPAAGDGASVAPSPAAVLGAPMPLEPLVTLPDGKGYESEDESGPTAELVLDDEELIRLPSTAEPPSRLTSEAAEGTADVAASRIGRSQVPQPSSLKRADSRECSPLRLPCNKIVETHGCLTVSARAVRPSY